jgi:hypothetical protein
MSKRSNHFVGDDGDEVVDFDDDAVEEESAAEERVKGGMARLASVAGFHESKEG